MKRQSIAQRQLIPKSTPLRTVSPVVTYQAGEPVIVDGSRTDWLLILKKGAVASLKDDIEIAKVTEPGAVFGELSVLLDQPNKMDVRALETSLFYVADAGVLLRQNPIAARVAMALARQVDNANDLQIIEFCRGFHKSPDSNRRRK